jgi:hypothetical protein
MNNPIFQIDNYTYCVLEQIRKEYVIKSQEKEKKDRQKVQS